jgi:hypothetical protein
MADLPDLPAHLRSLGRRLRLRDGWLLAQRALWLACLAAILIQVAGRLWPLPRLWLWSLAPLAAWLLAVLALSVLRPLSLRRVARRADLELGLKERLSTALEMESRPGPGLATSLISRQHRDALDVARAIEPRRAFPLRWQRRPLIAAALLALAALALALLPNPMDDLLAERQAVARAVEEQADQVAKLRQEVEEAESLSPEDREALLRQLDELLRDLEANPGDREEALADLSRAEEALRRQLDPDSGARQAALEALAGQLQSLAGQEADPAADAEDLAETLQALAEQLEDMDAADQSALAQALAAMAGQAAQAGDQALAQALSALAQAAQAGDQSAAAESARAAAGALAQAQDDQAAQAALRQALSQLQAGRQAVAQAGQGPGQAAAQGDGQSPDQGPGQGPGQGQSPGPGQGQGNQAGSGGGTTADSLPPAQRTGRAGRPQGEGQSGGVGSLDQEVYVPWDRRPGTGEELVISGNDTGQGATQVRERQDPLPGSPGEALVPYHEVYYDYLDAANQAMEHSYVPPALQDYVRDYFSQLEP